MEFIIHLNNGKTATVRTEMHDHNCHILARQISECDMVHTVSFSHIKYEDGKSIVK